MAFTKIAAAGIGSTGTVTLQNIIVTGSVSTPSITGAASTENVRTNSLSVSGVTTSSGGFVGNVTGNSTGLSGTPNITVGSIIASSATISGNVSVAGTVTYEDVTNVDSVGVITARSSVIVGAGLSVVGVTTLSSAGGITTTGGSLFTKQLDVFGSSSTAKLNLSGISSTISSTAVDVFVYDTRKDSDGGQWRKRTQHTSWYNETLNTATRGSRRDFPAVAVIVATDTTITIYDGDDPDMPIWMVFNLGYETYIGMINGLKSVAMFNGIMSHCGTYDLHVTNFISDKTNRYGDSSGITVNHKQPISGRNDNTSGNYNGPTTPNIINRTGNDVSMTVLPNAPIDSATGLPVPTIAVATNGGVSVLKDDGTVVNITGQTEAPYRIIFNRNNSNEIVTSGYWTRVMKVYNIPTSSIGEGGQLRYYVDSEAPKIPFGGGAMLFESAINNELITSVSGGTPANGFYRISENLQSKTNGMVAYATTSFNTGWMHGDIKGAWLSDTSTVSVTGTELVTNGTFTTNTTGWTANGSGTNSFSVVSSALSVVRGSSGLGAGEPYQNITLTAGVTYTLSYQITSGDMTVILFDGTIGGSTIFSRSSSTTGWYNDTFTVSTTGIKQLLFIPNNSNTTAVIDNVSIRFAERDRSVNNKSLAVYGTITKSVVATGSNLVGYGGWSSSNYLQQPYNSALNFGTGDFSIMGWMNDSASSGSQTFVYWGIDGETGGRLLLSSTGTVFNFYAVTAGWSGEATVPTIRGRGWTHICCTRTGTRTEVYVNGVKGTTGTAASDLSNSSAVLRLGYRTTTSAESANSSSISLVRFSASVPSPTQIAKIYNDEKALFQPNSQCTLYGSSDAVTALAYDDTTKLLSVGTSSGRSDFQGLERINNTTTAVTTAISASNGLIAEQ